MCPYAPGDFRLAIALLQQPRRFHPPLLQSLKVPAHPRWIAHAETLPQKPCKCQYIIQCSIIAINTWESSRIGESPERNSLTAQTYVLLNKPEGVLHNYL